MSKFLTLLRLQLLGVFGINKMLKSKKDNTANVILLGFAVVAIIGLAVAGSYWLSMGAGVLGPYDVLPSLSIITVFIIALVFTYMRAKGVLFGHKDYDATMSLPVSATAIVLSRIAMLYFAMLAFSMVVFIPAMAAYGEFSHSAHGFIMLGAAMFLAPLIPMTATILLGTAMVALTSRFRFANVFVTIIAFILIGVYFYFIFTLQTDMITGDAEVMGLDDLGLLFSGLLANFYPPAGWLVSAMTYANWGYFALFAAVSLIPFALYIFITAKFYVRINTRLAARRKRSNYKLGELKTSTPFKALYKREMRRLPTSVLYTMNTLMGPLMLLAAAIAILVIDIDTIAYGLGLEGYDIRNYIAPFAFIVPMFLAPIYPASCVNLSLEGRNNWIMCSIPVSAKTIFHSKIAMSLTLTLPVTIISCILLIIALAPGVLTSALLLLTPAAYITLNSFMAMYANAKFPNYDWDSEYRLLKGTGSAAVLIVSIGGMLLSIILITLAIIFGIIINPAIISAAILALCTVGILIFNRLLAKEKLFA
ncbi:MAG: hypothetical protein FWB74_03295 [Defluviitaleaceae bacterium]|nr:hypothetical protein [Defluviitaleaceae bacterium]